MSFCCWSLLLLCIVRIRSQISSPISPRSNYSHSIVLQVNVSNLWWTVNETSEEITFELHVKTTGWIALGISPGGGMAGADIAVGWVDSTGKVYLQDRYATGHVTPTIDTTSTDWFVLGGREENGWTAIQFKRLLDTCDTMDVAIPYGTNRLIYAYGLVDPFLASSADDIAYHGVRKGSLTLSLRAYNDPPLASKFSALDAFEFRLTNYTVPATDTTYFCQVFKAPSNYSSKRHVIGHQMLINDGNRDLVHHLLLYECDPMARFNHSNLPRGICDDIFTEAALCMLNIAIGWAVGGQMIEEFPVEAGYPMGGNSTTKYYLIQMHYDNPNFTASRVDDSGLRFFVTDNLRPNDLGFLTFGTSADTESLAIPPQVSNFTVDSFCPTNVSAKFPATGLTIFSAFPHTHLQGRQLWTKLIRNGTVVDCLFNAESYDFNFQINHHLPQPMKIYPGDTFVTRCIYNTMNKQIVTMGGERTRDEMCLNMFTYYPRIENVHICLSRIPIPRWNQFLNTNVSSSANLTEVIKNLIWTSNLTTQWQEFYRSSPRAIIYGISSFANPMRTSIPNYIDLKSVTCTVRTPVGSSGVSVHSSFLILFCAQFIFFFCVLVGGKGE